MVETITEYERVHIDAIDVFNKVFEAIKFKIIDMAEDEIDLADRDYDFITKKIEDQICDIKKAKVRYIYDKMDRDEFELILKNISEGKPTTIVVVGKKHKLRSMDTLRLLSLTYNVSIDKILSHNGITVEDFDDLKERGIEIDIPIVVDLKLRTKHSELPVFGSINGMKGWGQDINNDVEIDTDTGDIKVMGNEDTLIQGILNRFGEYGSIPGYEKHTIDLAWGKDYPSELVDVMTIAKLEEVLKADPRIREIEDIRITTQEQGKLVEIDAKAINYSETITAKHKRENEEYFK
jgi:hypothetical protein